MDVMTNVMDVMEPEEQPKEDFLNQFQVIVTFVNLSFFS